MKKSRLLLMIFLVSCMLIFPLSSNSQAEEYIVGVHDVIKISVLQPEKLDSTVTVAPDGMISFPYIESIAIKGMTLKQIEEEVQSRLADGYMKYPAVSVSLIESRSRKFFVYGEVNKPGTYFLDENMTVLKAISIAGGFTKYGSSMVKVLHEKKDMPGYNVEKVNIKQVMEGKSESDIVLRPGDIVVISEGVF